MNGLSRFSLSRDPELKRIRLEQRTSWPHLLLKTFFLNIEGEDPSTAKAALWTKKPKLNLLTTASGKILVKPLDKESTDILKSISQKKPGTLIEGKPRLLRIIIRNLDTATPAAELPGLIATQNPELNIPLEEAITIIKPIFKRGKRDLPTVSWVCEVLPSIYKKVVNNRSYVGFL